MYTADTVDPLYFVSPQFHTFESNDFCKAFIFESSAIIIIKGNDVVATILKLRIFFMKLTKLIK